MKIKIVSIVFCAVALVATVYLVKLSMNGEISAPQTTAPLTAEETAPAETPMSRAYVIETAHDAEDLIAELASQQSRDIDVTLPDLAERLEKSAKYLKEELQDYYGSAYFSEVAAIVRDVIETPFTDAASFSARVPKILTELENAYPKDAALSIRETDPVSPMYYPVFQTDASGTFAKAMLTVYRLQYAKATGSVLLTFGGNLSFGDTILGAESENSFKKKAAADENYNPLSGLAPLLQNDTLSFANLVSPLTETSSADAAMNKTQKGLPSYSAIIRRGGIDAVTIANDAIGSYSAEGKADTEKALQAEGVAYSDGVRVIEEDSAVGKIVILSYNIIKETGTKVNYTFADAPKADIAAARAKGAKIVVVSFNWVTTQKNAAEPNMTQVLTTRAAVDNGADLVIGTTPDVISSIERYKGVSIVYAPGKLADHNTENSLGILFQQAFSLDEAGNLVRGQISVFPIATNLNGNGEPALLLDQASATSLVSTLTSASRSVRYGVGKRAEFTTEELNVISLNK